MSWKTREECLLSKRETLTVSDAAERDKMKIKEGQLLDSTTYRSVVTRAKAQWRKERPVE